MGINKVFSNAKWVIGCKIIQSLLQLVIGMLSARYLGPSNYGLISYAASLVAFAVPVMQLGLRGTLVQEYIQNPEKEGEILGTGLVMNMVSAGACILAVSSFAMGVNRGEGETILVCVLYSLSLLFQAVEMVQYWFQSKLLSKYPSLAMLGAYLAVSCYKIWLLMSRKSVYWFAVSHSVEYGLIGIALLVIYRKLGGGNIRFSRKTAGKMFAKSKYYILSGLMVTVFQNTDHIMLKLMINEAENGFYTTAVTCASMAGFVYAAIIDSARPVILENKGISAEAYERSLSALYAVIIYLALAQGLGFTLLAKPIVWLLYGEAYFPAVPVLQVLVWYIAFSYMGSVRNIWILAEGEQHLLWQINLGGALANVALNYVLIPLWGACGAALASVLTQFATNFLLGFLLKPIRPNNRILLKGLNPKLFVQMISQFLKKA